MDALDFLMLRRAYEAQRLRRKRNPLSEPRKVKGQCRKCLKIIGRGVFMHERSCRGDLR